MYSLITHALIGLLVTPVFALSTIGSGSVGITTASPLMQQNGACTSLTRNLMLGSRDYQTGGDVKKLQDFLSSDGNLQTSSRGFFGILTRQAVIQFQSSQGIFTTGYVGMLTRAAIERLSCGTTPPTSSLYIRSLSPNAGAIGSTVTIYGSGFTSDNTILFGGGALVHVRSYDGSSISFNVPGSLNPRCYYSQPACLIASQQTLPGSYNVSIENSNGASNAISFTVTSEQPKSNVTIYSISPNSGPVGTTISITGFGFTNSNTVHIGGGAIGTVPIASSIAIACTTNPACHGGINQTLTVTIPSSIGPYCASGMMCPMYMQLLTPGTYTIYVQNDNGSSNAVSFTVTGSNNTNQAPSITSIDAPSGLSLGTTGTWTIHATVLSGASTNLHYSVNWGDQLMMTGNNAIMAPYPSPLQSSATFTHAYSQAGTYTAVFTVSDDSGNSSQVSSTIAVTPIY
jgi:hypothetical protein